MRKITKKIIAIFLLTGMALVRPSGVVSVKAEEWHTNPSTNRPCTNTLRDYSHKGIYTSYMLNGHRLANGVLCVPTRITYIHQVNCSSCNAVINEYFVSECTEQHSQCSTFLELHPSL